MNNGLITPCYDGTIFIPLLVTTAGRPRSFLKSLPLVLPTHAWLICLFTYLPSATFYGGFKLFFPVYEVCIATKRQHLLCRIPNQSCSFIVIFLMTCKPYTYKHNEEYYHPFLMLLISDHFYVHLYLITKDGVSFK